MDNRSPEHEQITKQTKMETKMKTQTHKLWAAMLSLFVAMGVAYGDIPPAHVYIQVKG